MGSAESSTGSHCRPLDLGMAALRHELMSTSGSAPTSPKTSVTSAAAAAITAAAPPSGHLFQSSVQTHPLNLAGGCSLQRPNHYNVELLRTASASGNIYFISHCRIVKSSDLNSALFLTDTRWRGQILENIYLLPLRPLLR